MNPIIKKTLGGLSKEYYFRQLVFGLILFVITIFLLNGSNKAGEGPGPGIFVYLFFAVNTLLYPYSRFVYETVVGFFMGDNVFFGSALTMMIMKFISMFMCWLLAIVIAPIGLLYLYFHHNNQEKSHQQ